jgi:hypothetical protein
MFVEKSWLCGKRRSRDSRRANRALLSPFTKSHGAISMSIVINTLSTRSFEPQATGFFVYKQVLTSKIDAGDSPFGVSKNYASLFLP